jgi:hypothetical protein
VRRLADQAMTGDEKIASPLAADAAAELVAEAKKEPSSAKEDTHKILFELVLYEPVSAA